MKGARINFGVPNSEYVLLADDDGVAVSLKNQDTDTEYIGGGGSSDFSTATISLSDYSLENENYESTDIFPFDMQIPNISDDKINNKITLNSFDDVIVVPLYKGVLFFVEGAMDTSVAAVSGDIVMETVDELPIINEYTITGNGTFKLGWAK